LIHRTAGVDQDPQFYIALGETAKDSKKCFAAVEERYKKEPTNTTYFAEYLTLVSNTCLDFQKDLDSFLFRLTEDDYLQEENWKLIQNHLADFNHKVTQYVSKNTSKFQDKFGDQVGAFLYNSVRQTAFDLLNEPDFQEYKYQLLLKNSKLIEITEIQSIVPMLEVYGFERKGEWDNLFDYLMKNGDTILDSENKNRYSYLISENTTSEVYLKKAEKWMIEVISEGENWNNLDTYAHVLVKLNKKKEALIIAEKSLKRVEVEELTEEQINSTKSFIDEMKTEN